jgi:hypothetical protein
VLILSAIGRSPCGLTHRMRGKSVLEGAQQIVYLFQTAVSVPGPGGEHPDPHVGRARGGVVAAEKGLEDI